MSPERVKKGDLLCFGRFVAIVMKVEGKDVHFVYLNRHVPGTEKYERWRTTKKQIRMDIVSSA